MKIKILQGWRWILAVSATATLLGCLDQTHETGAQTIVEPSATTIVEKPTAEEVDLKPVRAIIPPANLSTGLSEVVKLAQSGVSEQVLLAYVEKSNHAFNPSVDEIVYLKDIGIADSVVALMVSHQAPALIEAAPVPSTVENKTVLEPQTNPNGPSVIDPNAPTAPIATENYTEPPQQVTINYFENTLSPYGNWVEVADYGRCWQPTVVAINRNWRPYADRGRWIYTSSGWYWQSDYSWGWAPFHYGRWHCDSRIGWVWVPGSTWGPAWVSWRYSDDYCGWAPLPPSARYVSGFGFSYYNSHVGINFEFGLPFSCYTFIPTSRFCERYPSRYYASGSHTRTIYNNSVVINNYIRGNNNTIINEGVGRERITRATKTPIRTVSLRELPTSSAPTERVERLEGNTLTVFKPHISETTSSRAVTQRSITGGPNRNTRTTSTTTLNTSAVTTAPIDPAPKKNVTRTLAPTATTQTSSSLKAATESSPQRSIATTRSAPSEQRNLSNRNESQQVNRSIERREPTVAPLESPRALEQKTPSVVTRTPVLREAQVTPTPIVRTAPIEPQMQKAQPGGREIRRQETSAFNNPGEQRSLRSMAPAPSAPASVQQFNSPRAEHQNRVERSVQQSSSPTHSAPAPSVRQSAPRQEAPAQRQQIERSVERSPRSERSRS